MTSTLSASVWLLILSAPIGLIAAQEPGKTTPEEQKCEAPFYTWKEVSRRAKITHKPSPETTEEFRVKQSSGRAILTAVLCKTGEVTDIIIIEGLPYGMNEKLIQAVRGVKFTPAEKDGQAVSQRQRFEFNFNRY